MALWIATILLLGLSVVTVYSFVPILVKVQGGTPLGYLSKHFMYIVIGVGLMYWIHKKDVRYVEKLTKFIFVVAVALLVFTFFFGVSVNHATRWVRIPIIGLTFQSSDFAKVALVIFVAKRLEVKRDLLHSWKEGFLPIILPVLLVCGLIAKDNFSTAALLFLIILGMFYIGKVPFSKIFITMLVGVVVLSIAVLIHYALPDMEFLPRLETWINRFFRAYGDESGAAAALDNMQAINAKLAIHNGGYFGVGIGSGDLKHYTPEAYADFYYSSFIEEFGVIFAIGLALIYLIMFHRILKIGLRAEKMFETYLCVGIGMLFISQALTNMFVCTGLMPVTGQNMPFLGMGGSAMVMSCMALGVVLSIADKNSSDDKSKNAIK